MKTQIVAPSFLALALLVFNSSAWAQTGDAPMAPGATPAPAPAAPAEAVPVAAPADPEAATAVGIFFNPLSIAFGFYGLELDFAPMRALSVNLAGEYYSHSVSAFGFEVKTSAYEVNLGVQIFLTGHRPMQGAYIYPRFAYAKAKAEETGSTTAEASLIGVGATAGYQWNWQPFSLRLGGGLMHYSATASAEAGSPEISLAGTLPALDLTLGFVF